MGAIPLVGSWLRWLARRYPEGSEVVIRRGYAAGLRWRRSHRFVNGFWTGIYELSIQAALARELRQGDVFYDLGANAGFFTILGARLVGPQGRVYAFEPLHSNAASVREQIALNGLDHCTVVEAAVSDRSGRARLRQGEEASTAHLCFQETAGEGDAAVTTVTLDEFAGSHAAPDFIKIDVEGAEAAVLAGATAVLSAAAAPRLLIELHGSDCAARVEVALHGLGYRFRTLEGHPLASIAGAHHVLAVRQD